MECDYRGFRLILLPMDYAEGGSLRQWLVSNPDVKGRREQALDYFRQACEGVKAIHSAGLVHLDLKPDNLLLQGGVIKVADFGLSRGMGRSSVASPELLRDGVGTPWYMAPEQILAARPEELDHQTDIYSLGIILFEILDGAPPYKGTAAEILMKIKEGIRPRLRNVDGHPADVVWKCIERLPEDRYRSVAELLATLVVRDFSEDIRSIEQALEKEEFGEACSLLKKARVEGLEVGAANRLEKALSDAEQKVYLRKEKKERKERERTEAEAKQKAEEAARHSAEKEGLEREEKARQERIAKEQEAASLKAEAERKNRENEERQRKELLVCPVTGMEFVEVHGGNFDMGDVWGDGRNNEKPVHKVSIRTFLMGKYPVTQAQWEKVMGDNPSHFKGADRPVEQLSWNDCQEFIKRLNRASGRKYRLPSEAEWEYAARSGGKREKWSGTDEKSELGDYVWYRKNRCEETKPVGMKKPNGLGLYDMSGNVWEWCQDVWNDCYEGTPADGSPWEQGDNPTFRVLRGGSWDNFVRCARTADRNYYVLDYRSYSIGFRLVLPISDTQRGFNEGKQNVCCRKEGEKRKQSTSSLYPSSDTTVLYEPNSLDIIGIDIGTTTTRIACFEDDKPSVILKVKSLLTRQNKLFTSTDSMTFLLTQIKDTTEDIVGTAFRSVVITLPSIYNYLQRKAILKAVKLAGFNCIRTISDATCVALAYGFDKKEERIATFDLGGGKLDICILEIGEGCFHVKSTKGEFIGGVDFDRQIADWIAEELLRKEGVDIKTDELAMLNINEAAEKAKCELSKIEETYITIPLSSGGSLYLRLSRSKLEEICAELINKLEAPCKIAINEAKEEDSSFSVDKVIFVGGMTCMPAVQKKVQGIFGVPTYKPSNSDEMVAIGAAIQAGVLCGKIKNVLLLEVIGAAFGIETPDGKMANVINRNTQIPCRKSKVFLMPIVEGAVTINVFEGDDPIASNNNLIGKVQLLCNVTTSSNTSSGINNAFNTECIMSDDDKYIMGEHLNRVAPKTSNTVQVEVVFDVDANRTIYVYAKALSSGKEQNIRL
jgi:molecular chaperone DnaK (HSP70)/formylglycine-generating enzyme required for sulfatase activity